MYRVTYSMQESLINELPDDDLIVHAFLRLYIYNNCPG